MFSAALNNPKVGFEWNRTRLKGGGIFCPMLGESGRVICLSAMGAATHQELTMQAFGTLKELTSSTLEACSEM